MFDGDDDTFVCPQCSEDGTLFGCTEDYCWNPSGGASDEADEADEFFAWFFSTRDY